MLSTGLHFASESTRPRRGESRRAPFRKGHRVRPRRSARRARAAPRHAAGAAYACARCGRLPRARMSVSRHRARYRRGGRRSDAHAPRHALRGSGLRSSSAARPRLRSILTVTPCARACLPPPRRTGAQYRVQTALARDGAHRLAGQSLRRGGALRGTLAERRSLAADLVVDASGRASPTLGFLEAIGSSKPPTIEIGIDQAYATTVFETPDDAPTDWLGVLHQPTPPGSSRLGLVMPMEGSRWSVSLCANHGEAPPSDIDGFMAFAKSLRMPTIYNAIRSAKRVGDIARFGMPSSVRRAFDKASSIASRAVVGAARGLGLPLPPELRGQGMSRGGAGGSRSRERPRVAAPTRRSARGACGIVLR